MAVKQRELRRVLIVVNSRKDHVSTIVQTVESFVRARGGETVRVDVADRPSPETLKGLDLAVSLGGDGTLLSCARLVATQGVPILAVNLGDFGFITEVARDELIDACENFLAGTATFSERLMLEVSVFRGAARGGLVHRAERRGGLHDGHLADDPAEGAASPTPPSAATGPTGSSWPPRRAPRPTRWPPAAPSCTPRWRRSSSPRSARSRSATGRRSSRRPNSSRSRSKAAQKTDVALTVDGQETAVLQTRRPGRRLAGGAQGPHRPLAATRLLRSAAHQAPLGG